MTMLRKVLVVFSLMMALAHGREDREMLYDHKFHGGEAAYKAMAESCGDFDYDVFLYVDAHFYALASPLPEAVAAGCPFVAARNPHVVCADGEKELLVWKNPAQGESLFPSDSLAIGTFPSRTLLDVFETANEKGSGPYDTLTRTCATFIVDMADKLGVEIDTTIQSFVVQRLVAEQGNALLESFKSSSAASYFSFFEKEEDSV